MDLDREEEVREAYNKYDPGWTAPPYDAKFPYENQFKYCLSNFIDYYRCKEIKGEDYVNCFYFRRVAEMTCPTFMREKWLEQIREERFPYHSLDKHGRRMKD